MQEVEEKLFSVEDQWITNQINKDTYDRWYKICRKREFVNLVFDSNLYYENGIYRTPTMLNTFSSNSLKIKQK